MVSICIRLEFPDIDPSGVKLSGIVYSQYITCCALSLPGNHPHLCRDDHKHGQQTVAIYVALQSCILPPESAKRNDPGGKRPNPGL